MRKLLSFPLSWGIAAIFSFVVHVLSPWGTNDAARVARCGATWVLVAGAIIARPIIRKGYTRWYESTRTIDSGTWETAPDQDEEIRQIATDARCVQLYGPALAAMGTILWAYGELIPEAVIKTIPVVPMIWPLRFKPSAICAQ